jgi:Right handed beta helix region
MVSDASGLQRALARAQPGTTITLSDGTYLGKDVKDRSAWQPGRFESKASGTADAPIVLRGSRNAVLDGGGSGVGYGLHLIGAKYWRLEGFTVQSALKGIVLDNSHHVVIDAVRVTKISEEGIHFRSHSTDNLLTNSVVDNTGLRSPNFGEGVYIGSAKSNWDVYTGGKPDRSDRNQVINNIIVDTAAENIDIKEGTTGGVIRGNYLGGDKLASKNSADSWIEVKGNEYLIEGNHGVTTPRPAATRCGDPKGDPNSNRNPFCDGIQVHVLLPGWGEGNTLRANVLEVNSPGAGIWVNNTVAPTTTITCDNRVVGAAAGAFAVDNYREVRCAP